MRNVLTVLVLVLSLMSLRAQDVANPLTCSIGIVGDTADVKTTTEFGVVLAGGSTDVDEGLQWMIRKAGGGDFVIIRASGSTGYNDYIKQLGETNSVETLLIDSREKAMLPGVGKKIREAEALFIAGGDQWNYVRFWSDSEVSKALDYLIQEKHVPVGGTSAGCAVLTDIAFDARSGSATSNVLSNPYDTLVKISKSFIHIPFLKNTIADQHYTQRERLGRHVVFMARMTSDFKIKKPRGIGVDEKTSVCIDKDGNATVYGVGYAHFIQASGKPEMLKQNTPLIWTKKNKALRVHIFKGSKEGTKTINVNDWPGTAPTEYWNVDNGVLMRNSI